MSILNNGLGDYPNSGLLCDNLTGVTISPTNISYNYDSYGSVYVTYDGTIQSSQLDYTYMGTATTYEDISIERIKQQFTPTDLIEAYGIEEFENVIRKMKLDRLMDKKE